MYKIKKLNKISPIINDIFDDKYVLGDEEITNPEGIIVRSFNMNEYETNEELLAISRAGAGVNNIPVEKMAQKGVVVFNTPGANANAVKELVICGMLLACRDIIGGNQWVNTLTENVAKTAEKGKSNFAGIEVFGKTLGVIGLGAIGGKVANTALSLGMDVVGYDPCLSENLKAQLDKNVKIVDFDTLIKESDFITLHVPLLDSTKNMINKDVIANMKDGAIIINMARGGLVNFADLKNALTSGKVRKYVVDFPDENVINTEGIIVLPHLGASTEEAEDNCAIMAAKELKDYIENGNINNSVNYPRCSAPKMSAVRLAICHLNQHNMIAQFTTILAENSINIEYLVNSSKGAYAYSMIDIPTVDSATIERLKNIEGVIRVRKL